MLISGVLAKDGAISSVTSSSRTDTSTPNIESAHKGSFFCGVGCFRASMCFGGGSGSVGLLGFATSLELFLLRLELA